MEPPANRSGTERRLDVRCDVQPVAARITWRGTWGSADLRVPASVLNVSRGGVAVETIFSPPKNCSFWISVDQLPNEWVRCTLVRVVRVDDELLRWHLKFSEDCPPGVLEAIIEDNWYGFTLCEEAVEEWSLP
jgi:hypothetical protein